MKKTEGKIKLYNYAAVAEMTGRRPNTIAILAMKHPELGIEVQGGEGKKNRQVVFTDTDIQWIQENIGDVAVPGRRFAKKPQPVKVKKVKKAAPQPEAVSA